MSAVRQCRFCGHVVAELEYQLAVADFYCPRCERNPMSHHRNHRSLKTCKRLAPDSFLAEYSKFKNGQPATP